MAGCVKLPLICEECCLELFSVQSPSGYYPLSTKTLPSHLLSVIEPYAIKLFCKESLIFYVDNILLVIWKKYDVAFIAHQSLGNVSYMYYHRLVSVVTLTVLKKSSPE